MSARFDVRAAWGGAWVVVSLLMGSITAASTLTDEELQEQLALWRESPLRLDVASAEELARLPWLDWSEAESIVGLREAGALRRVEDLRRVPGLDPERVRALSAFVCLDESERGARLRVEGRVTVDGAPTQRARLQGRWGAIAGVLLLQRGEALPTGTASLELGTTRWLFGRLRPAVGHGLLLADPLRRSRTGAVPGRARLSVDARTDAPSIVGLEGVAGELRLERSRVLGLITRQPGGERSWLFAAATVGVAQSIGTAVHAVDAEPEVALWWSRTRDPSVSMEWAGGGARRRGLARLDRRGERWRVQLAATSAQGGGGRGRDPIAGHPLDRPHRSLQAVARGRGDAWSVSVLGRAVWRGWPGVERLSRRVSLRLRWRRLSARAGDPRLQLDADLLQARCGVPAEARVRLRSEDGPGAWRRRLGFGWSGDGLEHASLAWVQLETGERLRWRLVGAAAAGTRSTPWAVAFPEATLLGVWLRPGESALGGGVGLRSTQRRLGLWAMVASGEGSRLRVWAGLQIGVRIGSGAGVKVAARARGVPEILPARSGPAATVEP